MERFPALHGRKANHVIGVCPPDNRQSDPCERRGHRCHGPPPEYMPVLIAVVEAVTDPVFRIQDAVDTRMGADASR